MAVLLKQHLNIYIVIKNSMQTLSLKYIVIILKATINFRTLLNFVGYNKF